MHTAKIVFYVYFAHTCAKNSKCLRLQHVLCNLHHLVKHPTGMAELEHMIDSSYSKLLRLIMIQGFY